MNSVQGQALVMAALIEFTLAAMSVVTIATSRRGARGALARNPYVGLRIPSTMRSDEAWVAGHRAAAHTAPLHVLFNAVLVVSLGVAAWHGWRLVVAFIGGGGFFAVMGLLIGTAVIAGRAARVADDHADHSSAVGYSAEMPAVMSHLSGRTMTTIGWLCALSACGVTVFMLGSIIDGYLLAIHQQLQPNPTFGIRDEISFSCLPRWYAAQKAGFTWLLFGYGPVLVVSLLMCVGAAKQRRSPWDICALVLGTVFVAIVFVVAAGSHADSVARVINC